MSEQPSSCTAWLDDRILAQGSQADVAVEVRTYLDQHPEASILTLDDQTSRTVDFDLRGSVDEVRERYQATIDEPETPRRGRPKLGVEPREVTLLPRHWEWLNRQSGGASAALRKIVELSMRESATADRQRDVETSVYRFWTNLSGDRPGYEEACRSLFAHDYEGVRKQIENWPEDIQKQTSVLLGRI